MESWTFRLRAERLALLGLCALCVASPPTRAESNDTETRRIVGTCLHERNPARKRPPGSSYTPPPLSGVEITHFPSGTVAISDDQGDFFLEWTKTGKSDAIPREYLELRLPDSAFCKQMILGETDGSEADWIDVGAIPLTPSARPARVPVAELPAGTTPPDEIAEADYLSHERRIWFALRIDFDRFGEVVDVVHHTGDTPNEAVLSRLKVWAKSLPWIHKKLVRCESPHFRTILPIAYRWNPDANVWQRDPNNRPQ